jgi:hypothetical protein
MSKNSTQWINDMNEEDFFSLSSQMPVELVEPGDETNKKIDEEIQRTRVTDEYFRPKKWVMPFLKYGVAAACILIITSVLLFTFTRTGQACAITLIKSGTISVIREGKVTGDGDFESYKKGDTLITGDTSSHTLGIDGSVVRLNPETRVSFVQKSEHTILTALDYGEMFIQTGGLTQGPRYEVLTPNATIRFNSCVFVTYREHTTTVALYKGKADVKQGKRDEAGNIWMLEEGECIMIGEAMLPEKTAMSQHMTGYLQAFYEMSEILTHKDRSGLEITTGITNVRLFIDGKSVQDFDENILVYLSTGEHNIRLEKQGYTPYTRIVSLPKNRILSLDTSLHWHSDNDKIVQKHLGKANVVHRYTNQDNPNQSVIIGFSGTPVYVLAVTQTSLICFNSTGSLLWEQSFGREEKILFDSIPYIHESTAYVSSYYTLMTIDLATGEHTLHDAPGMISEGFSMTAFNDWLYLPYPDGLYRIRLDGSPDSPQPFITFHNPVQPLVTGEGIYLNSCIFPSLALYSFEGVCKKQIKTSSPSLCPPFIHGSFLITGNDDGTITKLHTDLSHGASLHLGHGISWLSDGKGETFHAFTEEGVLYNVHGNDLSILGEITIDTIPDPTQYLYKRPVRIDYDLLIGTKDGHIMVIDLNSFNAREFLSITDEAISCSIFPVKDAFFVGTKEGKIIRVEYGEE